MSEAQNRLVQARFGAAAAAYVASAGHAGGEDLERLVAWGRALQPRRAARIASKIAKVNAVRVSERISGSTGASARPSGSKRPVNAARPIVAATPHSSDAPMM